MTPDYPSGEIWLFWSPPVLITNIIVRVELVDTSCYNAFTMPCRIEGEPDRSDPDKRRVPDVGQANELRLSRGSNNAQQELFDSQSRLPDEIELGLRDLPLIFYGSICVHGFPPDEGEGNGDKKDR